MAVGIQDIRRVNGGFRLRVERSSCLSTSMHRQNSNCTCSNPTKPSKLRIITLRSLGAPILTLMYNKSPYYGGSPKLLLISGTRISLRVNILSPKAANLDFWVAVEGLKVSSHIGEAMLITMYAHYGNPKP